ncbi:M15 family metallopeptidase [Promicromonospora panici]|uniref:M15 family metallopeptidase n=1 Tax=Promicromonospora panici TaxID=2219658 RepID=UPI00101E0EA1|nr:M15 family metallopeptidase [Promicromonospora panici]
MLTQTPLWPELQAPRRPPWPRRGRRASGRRKRRTIGIVAVALTMVVVAGSAYAFDMFGPEVTDPPSAVAEAQTAIAESATLRADLAGEIKDARTVLKSPDGQAAKKPERRTLNSAIDDAQDVVTSLKSVASSPSGTMDEANAVLGLTSVLHDDVPVVTAALRDAASAVVASGRQVRLERAASEVEAARSALQAVVTDGEQVYAESANARDRGDLRTALDLAGDLTAQADELLEAAANAQADDVADLIGKAGRLTTAMPEATVQIQVATAALLAETSQDGTAVDAGVVDPATDETSTDPVTNQATAEDASTAAAGTCPEPDQVWSAENGHLSSSELASIPFASSHYVRADVVGGLTDLNAAYAAEFGVNLTINSSYRTYAEQEALYDPSSDTAAPPGCSNHGTGLAIDIGGGVQTFGSAQYDWLKANAEAYGWVHPPFAEPSGRNPEPWHWQSVQAPNSY